MKPILINSYKRKIDNNNNNNQSKKPYSFNKYINNVFKKNDYFILNKYYKDKNPIERVILTNILDKLNCFKNLMIIPEFTDKNLVMHVYMIMNFESLENYKMYYDVNCDYNNYSNLLLNNNMKVIEVDINVSTKIWDCLNILEIFVISDGDNDDKNNVVMLKEVIENFNKLIVINDKESFLLIDYMKHYVSSKMGVGITTIFEVFIEILQIQTNKISKEILECINIIISFRKLFFNLKMKSIDMSLIKLFHLLYNQLKSSKYDLYKLFHITNTPILCSWNSNLHISQYKSDITITQLNIFLLICNNLFNDNPINIDNLSTPNSYHIDNDMMNDEIIVTSLFSSILTLFIFDNNVLHYHHIQHNNLLASYFKKTLNIIVSGMFKRLSNIKMINVYHVIQLDIFYNFLLLSYSIKDHDYIILDNVILKNMIDNTIDIIKKDNCKGEELFFTQQHLATSLHQKMTFKKIGINFSNLLLKNNITIISLQLPHLYQQLTLLIKIFVYNMKNIKNSLNQFEIHNNIYITLNIGYMLSNISNNSNHAYYLVIINMIFMIIEILFILLNSFDIPKNTPFTFEILSFLNSISKFINSNSRDDNSKLVITLSKKLFNLITFIRSKMIITQNNFAGILQDCNFISSKSKIITYQKYFDNEIDQKELKMLSVDYLLFKNNLLIFLIQNNKILTIIQSKMIINSYLKNNENDLLDILSTNHKISDTFYDNIDKMVNIYNINREELKNYCHY